MKKLSIILTLCLIVTTIQAQNRLSYSFEIAAGAGIGKGPLLTLTPEFVASYDLESGFYAGAGAGLRFAMPCSTYSIYEDGSHKRNFDLLMEFDLPVFLRFGYGKEKFFANIDAGYAIGIFNWYPSGRGEPCYDGFFIEPKIGCKLGSRGSLAFGVVMQKGSMMVSTITKNLNTSTTDNSRQKLLAPAVTLRYGISF